MPKHQGFSGGSVVKNPASDSEDIGSIPGLGRSTGGGNGYPLQYSCLENPMDRRAWWATIQCGKELDMTEATQHSTSFIYWVFIMGKQVEEIHALMKLNF